MKPDQNKPYDVYEHACYLISCSHVNTYGMSISEVMGILRKIEYYNKEGLDLDIQEELDKANAFRMYYDLD
jgi:hypothetical protein